MLKKIQRYATVYFFVLKKIFKYGGICPLLSFVLNIVSVLVSITQTYFIGLFAASLVNSLIDSNIDSLSSFWFLAHVNQAVQYGLVIILSWFIKRFLSFLIFMLDEYFNSNRFLGFYYDVAQKFSKLNLEEVESKDVYSHLTNIRSVTFDKFKEVYKLFNSLISSFVGFITVSIIIFNHNSVWFLILVLVNIPEGFLNVLLTLRDKRRLEKNLPIRVMRDYTFDTILDTRTVGEKKVDGLFAMLLKKYKEYALFMSRSDKDQVKVSQIGYLFFNSLSRVVAAFFQINAIVMTITRQISISTGINIFNYVDYLWTQSNNLVQNTVDIIMMETYLKDFYEYENIPTLHEKSKGTSVIGTNNINIELKNLSFSYPISTKPVFKNWNLVIKNKEKILILGKDGSGKSSIVKILTGLYKINKGDILINGISIKKLAPSEWKSKLSTVFDDFGRYYYTIRDNITMGDEKINKDLLSDALNIVMLDEWLLQNKLSLDQPLGALNKKGIELPSGYWQRIAIARAIYRNKSILIFDEPFSSIDTSTKRQIMRNLSKYWIDKTVVMIDEDDCFIKYFDDVYVIEDSQIRSFKNKRNWFSV